LLLARGMVTRRNGFNRYFNGCETDRVCPAGLTDPKIGRSRGN